MQPLDPSHLEPGVSAASWRKRAFREPLEVRLKRRTRWLRQWHGFLLAELRERARVPLAARLRALRHGFSSLHWRLYELDRNDPRDYLPSFADLDFGLERPHLLALRDKLTFSLVMDGLDVRHPRALAYLSRGRLVNLEAAAAGREPIAVGELVRRHGGVVVKPVSGFAGQRIVLLTERGTDLLANGRPVDATFQAQAFAGDEALLVTELVRQGAYAAAIAPAAVNTVRLLTLWDGGAPFVAAAAHRFGLPRTYPIDNFHGGWGGLSAPIDLATGVLGVAATLDAEGRLHRFESHPDTGARIAGVAVPGWAGVVSVALRVAAALPHVPYVGWDLVVTDEGASFLEANAPPGTLVWQVHGGLLRDPRVRRASISLGLH